VSAPSPTVEGFRAGFRRPSLTFAEIAWRWTLGATAAALFVFYCIEYLDTLPVTNADAALLSTRQPALVGRAIAHILRGSLNRAVLAASLVALALSVLWIIAASVGRLVTLRALLAYFRRDIPSSVSAEPWDPTKPRPIRALIDLNFFRAAVVLGTLLALAGAAMLSGFVSTKANPRPGLFLFLFVVLAGLILLAGWALNWWLSLAGLFAVRDGEDALEALSAAVTFFRERPGPVFAVSTWTGLAHLVAFSMATTAVSVPLAFIQVVPSRLVMAGVMVVTLGYFTVADWLYMVRLAGYVCIAEMPDALALATGLPAATSPSGKADAPEAAIDRNEPIMSDVPNVAVET
jgi:hypothetical protein